MERSKRQCPSPLNTALQTLFRGSRTILLLGRIRQTQISASYYYCLIPGPFQPSFHRSSLIQRRICSDCDPVEPSAILDGYIKAGTTNIVGISMGSAVAVVGTLVSVL